MTAGSLFGAALLSVAASASRIYGTNCSSCESQYSLFYFSGAGGLSNYIIQSGDKLYLTQYQQSGSKGGLVVAFTDSTNTNWNAKDTSGYYLNDDQSQATTHSRIIDLSSFAGKTISSVAANAESDTSAGSWAIVYEQLALVGADGRVHPLYTGQLSSPLGAGTGSSGVTGRGSAVDTNRNKGQYPTTTTTYYHTDAVGTARIISQGGGWPVWQGTFAPFGQEISPQISIDNNKFATYQHEDPSNLEDATFRKYSAVQGRFTSVDPYAGSIDLENPQTWNRYAYVLNAPTVHGDPKGLFIVDCDWDGGCMGAPIVDGVPQFVSNTSGLGGNSMVACPQNFCSGFAHITTGPYAGNIVFVQYSADANGVGGYSALTTPILDMSLPKNQIFAAYKLACQYASSPCSANDHVTVRYVGSTYNVQLVDNNLDVAAASADGHKDPLTSFHDGQDSYYIGLLSMFTVNAGHVVNDPAGVEAHYDAWGPYSVFHQFFEAWPSLLINTRKNSVAVPYTCSILRGCF